MKNKNPLIGNLQGKGGALLWDQKISVMGHRIHQLGSLADSANMGNWRSHQWALTFYLNLAQPTVVYSLQKYHNITACQVLGNLCALTLHDGTHPTCSVIRDLIKERYQEVPHVFYQSTPREVPIKVKFNTHFLPKNKKKINHGCI